MIQKLNDLCDLASEVDPNFVRASVFTQTLREASKCYKEFEENNQIRYKSQCLIICLKMLNSYTKLPKFFYE